MTLTPEGYRPRLAESELQRLLIASGAVSIEGPKWCGKTYLGLNSSNTEFALDDFNEYGISYREIAENDVRIALQGDPPHLIDEWQEVPGIWDAIRVDIDHNRYRGRYILTGSSTPKKKRPMHSGAGRINVMSMRTMSLFESGDSNGTVSLRDMFDSKDIRGECGITYDHLVELVLRGGWPGTLGWDLESCTTMISGYIERQISAASELDDAHRSIRGLTAVLRSLARNESTLATLDRIHKDTGVPIDTAKPLITRDPYSDEDLAGTEPAVSYGSLREYMDVFDRLHLIADQPAYDPNLRSSVRVGKAVKRHLTDPSLSASLLGTDKKRLMNDPHTFGFLFEALCERDLDIYVRSLGGRLFHYRDQKQREIDAVVEMPDGRWGAIEVKLGWNQIDAAAEGLLKIRKAIANAGGRAPDFLCVLYGVGGPAFRRKDGVYVVPIGALRNR